MLIVSMADRRVLRLEGGRLEVHADLSGTVSFDCNDMVVDGRGRAYVGNAGFDMRERPVKPRPTRLVLVTPEGETRVVDDQLVFPNGAAIDADGRMLVVAETFGQRLTAFTVIDDGSLTDRRTFADLPGHAPDGICLDAEGAVWVARRHVGTVVRIDPRTRAVTKTIEVGSGAYGLTTGSGLVWVTTVGLNSQT